MPSSISEELLLEAFDELSLTSVSNEWTNQVWQTDFCESHELPQCIEAGIEENDCYKKTLTKALRACREWGGTSDNNISGTGEKGFWNILADSGNSHRTFIAVLYSFIDACSKVTPLGSKLESGVISANIYVVLNQIPGSGAYKVFHPLLFDKAIDILKLWPQQKGANKRKHKQTGVEDEPSSGRQTKSRRTAASSQRRAASQPEPEVNMDDNDGDDDSDEDDSDSEIYGHCVDSEEAKIQLKKQLRSLLQDLVLLLSAVPLKESEQTVHHIIQLLAELTRTDVDFFSSRFNVEKTDIFSVKSIAQLAFVGLEYVCFAGLHGAAGPNTRTTFKQLISNIMMTYGSRVASSLTIPRDILTIKDSTLQYVCHVASKPCADSVNAVKVLVQHLCTKCPERAEYRTAVTQAAVQIMQVLPSRTHCALTEWLNKYSRNVKIGYRVFALDLVSLLLEAPERDDTEAEAEEEVQLMSKQHLLEIIVGRCSDKAPTVRAKALTCFSQCATSADQSLVSVVKWIIQQPVNRSLDTTPDDERQQEESQSHTINVGALIRRRTCDEKVGVRKAALQALESIIRLDLDAFQKPDVEMVHDRCMDPALSVRKQAMVSLTSLLQERPSSLIIQRLWLDGILPLVMDRETTAQEKCLQLLDDIILKNIVLHARSTGIFHILTWDLLNIVAGPTGQELRRYIHAACQFWAKQGKLNAMMVKSLTSHVNTDHSKAAWLMLAEMASSCNKLDCNYIVNCWNSYTEAEGGADSETLCRVLTVIGCMASRLPSDSARTLIEDLQRKLIRFDSTPEVITVVIGTLRKLCQAQPQAKGTIDTWCTDLLKASERYLSDVVLQAQPGNCPVNDVLLVRHLFTIGEVAQLAPTRTTERLFLFVESMLSSNGDFEENQSTPLSKHQLPPAIKAHAFVTLGKLCLQNEDLAKQCIAALARELETSDDAAIRNNVTVVMCDLCVRYTSLVDRYIPNIATGLRDKSSLVRKQTLTLLTHLLQEDFVKWKGSLFYHFVTALVDEDEEIRKFADFCLVHLLLARHPGMFYQHFVECVFHFNSYDKHKVYNKFPQSEREKKLFSLQGNENSKKRSTIYQLLLSHIKDEDRFQLMGKLCQEILGGITDGLIPLDEEATAGILKDTLVILSSKGIKLASMKTKAVEDLADEGDLAGAELAKAKNKFLTQVLKKNMVENIIPIIIELKHMFEKERSPLMRHLMTYLKEVMKDYRSEVQDVLVADKQLANEIEFDLRKFEEQQKEQQLEQERARRSATPNGAHRSPRQSPAQNITSRDSGDFITPQLRNTPNKGANKSCLSAPFATPAPVTRNRRHTLASTALLNSAKKARAEASRIVEERRRKTVNWSRGLGTTHDDCVSEKRTSTRETTGRVPLAPVSKDPGKAKSVQSHQVEAPDAADNELLKTPTRRSEQRAASTPEGDNTHLDNVTFCAANPNLSIVVPPSPIPSALPIRLYSQNKDTPSWITRRSADDDGEEKENDVVCMPSPEQKLPKPRTWNVKSPTKKLPPKSQRKQENADDSVAKRTRARRRKR